MKRSGMRLSLTALLVLVFGASPLYAVGVSTGFLATNPQVFPVGDLVDVNAIQNEDNFNWDSLPDIVFFQITPTTQDELDRQVILHVRLNFGSTELIDWWSRPFELRQWVESPLGSNGYYTNRQLGHLQNAGWMHEDSDKTYYAETSDFLSILDGSRISAGIAVVTIELLDENNTPLSSMTQTIQVYNPSAPSLQQPEENADLSSYPIFFTWNWSGGPISPSDITLTIIEGSPGDDGETVMETRNPTKIRYDGPPQFVNNHTYTGIAGGEQALEDGKTYFWQVKVRANTAVPGDDIELASNIYSFSFDASTPTASGGGAAGPEVDPIFNQLQAFLPPDMIAQLSQELEGYHVTEISVDGITGYQFQDLIQYLNPQSTSLMSVTVE